MVLLIDNYDSFTYNLAQYLGELGADVRVMRNDAVTVDDVRKMGPRHIVLSPGPGRPETAGVSLDVIRAFAPTVPMLGVCLGHQAMGMAFGGDVVSAPRLMHGKTSRIDHDGQGVFRGIDGAFAAGRYHSLVVSPRTWPEALVVTARTTEDGTIMGLRHREYAVHGVQFHPESVLTDVGRRILRNFLEM
jgi:anthranilate synthase/aminodeoxychorismate synthase-like glutamine amidotransferase